MLESGPRLSRFSPSSRAQMITLALGILLLLSPRAKAAAEVRYYASDAAAFKGEAVSGPGAAAFVLGLSLEGQIETRTLFKDGAPSEDWRSVDGPRGRSVTHRKGGLLSDEVTYAPDGRMVEEKFYPSPSSDSSETASPETPSEIREYAYSPSGLLVRVESVDTAGTILGSLEYSYDSQGRLSELASRGVFGPSDSGIVISGQGLAASWTASGGTSASRSFLTRYDSSGRTVANLRYLDGKLVASEKLEYDESGKLISSHLVQPEDKLVTDTSYGDSGKAIFILVLADGKEKSRETLSYDEKGRPQGSSLVEGKSRTSKNWEYDGKDYSSRETTIVNGVLSSVFSKRADGSELLALYDNGTLFLERLSIGGKVKKESYYLNGSLLRVKEYP